MTKHIPKANGISNGRERPWTLYPNLIAPKSYGAPALLTLLFYWLVWPIGLILNIIYLVQAYKSRSDGLGVRGISYLWVLLFLVGLFPFTAAIFIVILYRGRIKFRLTRNSIEIEPLPMPPMSSTRLS